MALLCLGRSVWSVAGWGCSAKRAVEGRLQVMIGRASALASQAATGMLTRVGIGRVDLCLGYGRLQK